MKKVMNKAVFMLVAGALLLNSCENDDEMKTSTNKYSDVMANDVKMELVDDASITPYNMIFDVSPYFDDGHLPFAKNTGGVDGLGDMLAGLDKDKTYLVYCHADGPSIAGAELLIENGFTNVHRLEGNYGAWDAISFADIAAATVKAKVDAGNFEAIFDVSPMFNNGHIPGATNANESGGGTDLATLIASMDKTKEYLVYCHGDAPAMAGAQLMEDNGFANVYRLEGNFGAWNDAGYTVESGGSEITYTDVMASQIKTDLVDDAAISPYMAIFDVSPHYNNGHLPFATNAGSLESLGTMLDGLDKTKTYLVYCHADGPSIAGAELLIENGFTNVHRLEGNYGAWDAISFEEIAASTAKAKIDAGDFEAIFDVSPAYNSGHLPGATNANTGGGGTDLATLIASMDKTKEYLVYCHGNGPAMAASQLMEDEGFSNVYRLEGNYGAWTDAGYPTE